MDHSDEPGTRGGTPGGLRFLRAAALALPIFLFTWLNFLRSLPPLRAYIEGGAAVVLGIWWITKIVKRQGLARSPLALPLARLSWRRRRRHSFFG